MVTATENEATGRCAGPHGARTRLPLSRHVRGVRGDADLAHRPGLRRGRDRRPAGTEVEVSGDSGDDLGWVEQELRSIVGHRQFHRVRGSETAGTRRPSARRRTCSARSSSWATDGLVVSRRERRDLDGHPHDGRPAVHDRHPRPPRVRGRPHLARHLQRLLLGRGGRGAHRHRAYRDEVVDVGGVFLPRSAASSAATATGWRPGARALGPRAARDGRGGEPPAGASPRGRSQPSRSSSLPLHGERREAHAARRREGACLPARATDGDGKQVTVRDVTRIVALNGDIAETDRDARPRRRTSSASTSARPTPRSSSRRCRRSATSGRSRPRGSCSLRPTRSLSAPRPRARRRRSTSSAARA